MKGLGFRQLVVLLAVLSTLVAFELVLRASRLTLSEGSLRDLHELRPDRRWLFGLRPGAETTLEATGSIRYRINAQGFRDQPRAPHATNCAAKCMATAFTPCPVPPKS